ncbi:type II secretion system F family protein [Rhodoferax sp.]|uniref:type II secretion system F family protein n=1 Tax=Rhodoferax sp. TaxID=50421 RepID=UPI0027554F0A|nr:type II secretion system F family protein [Rhodoferax sp.]
MPDEDREYLDPLPKVLRLMWPLIRLVDYHVCQLIPHKLLAGPTESLRLSGLLYLMSATQFIALCLISLTGFTVATAVVLSAADLFSWWWVLGLAVLGYIYPRIWLKESLKKRQKAIVRSLPTYLDFLTMSVEAGLNVAGAISQAVSKGPAGPLKNEFGYVLRDLRSGLTRSEALRRMDERVRVPQVSSFVSAVVQAERMGASLGNTFRAQAEQRRSERFQIAEKLAMEAPVKLIFPLVAFIFPVTFIVLMFPIAMKFMQSGASF